METNFPSLHNPSNNKEFPLVDPYFFDFAQINFTRSKVAKGNFVIRNMTIFGAATTKFIDLKIKPGTKNAMTVITNVSLAQIKAIGKFKSELTISEYAFNSRGQFDVIMSGITAKFVVNGNLIDNGETFNVTRFAMFPNVSNMKFNVTGTGRDENLSKTCLVNDNI